jgi:hypothetical protein
LKTSSALPWALCSKTSNRTKIKERNSRQEQISTAAVRCTLHEFLLPFALLLQCTYTFCVLFFVPFRHLRSASTKLQSPAICVSLSLCMHIALWRRRGACASSFTRKVRGVECVLWLLSYVHGVHQHTRRETVSKAAIHFFLALREASSDIPPPPPSFTHTQTQLFFLRVVDVDLRHEHSHLPLHCPPATTTTSSPDVWKPCQYLHCTPRAGVSQTDAVTGEKKRGPSFCCTLPFTLRPPVQ